MSKFSDTAMSANQKPAPAALGVAVSGWSDDDTNRLLDTLQFISDELQFDRAEMLLQIAKHTEAACQQHGPPPNKVRVWLTEHVNRIQGYDHIKRDVVWPSIVPHYDLSTMGQGQPHARPATPCTPAVPDNPMHDQSPPVVYIDLESYRWWYALRGDESYMLWALARSLTKSNRVHIDDLLAASPWKQAYTYRLLMLNTIASDNNPFYRGKHDKWLYLRGEVDMNALCAGILQKRGYTGVLDGRKPGLRKRQLAVTSAVSDVYAAWLDSKRSTTMSRQTQATLWHVSKMTVIRWHKAAGIEAKKNFAQTANIHDPRLPVDRDDLKWATIDGKLVAMFQRANTYTVTTTYREHPHKGQARKVRKAVNAVLETAQQAETLAAMHPYRVRNFTGGGNVYDALKAYQHAVKNRPFASTHDYLYIGPRQSVRGVQVWELMAPRPRQDAPATEPRRFERV